MMRIPLRKHLLWALASMALFVALFSPKVALVALLVLLIALCPLAMLWMMRTMHRGVDASEVEIERLKAQRKRLEAELERVRRDARGE